jgi:hypothetical protein
MSEAGFVQTDFAAARIVMRKPAFVKRQKIFTCFS